MKIEFAELRQLLDLILDEMEEDGSTAFDVPEKLYWNIRGQKRYDPYLDKGKIEKLIGLGDLEDEWGLLQDLKDDDRIPNRYELVWLGQILIAIGDLGEKT